MGSLVVMQQQMAVCHSDTAGTCKASGSSFDEGLLCCARAPDAPAARVRFVVGADMAAGGSEWVIPVVAVDEAGKSYWSSMTIPLGASGGANSIGALSEVMKACVRGALALSGSQTAGRREVGARAGGGQLWLWL